MFDGHLQVLFYAIPPNSQLLFSETGNAPLLRDFHEPVGPQRCMKSKCCITPKVYVWWSPSSLVLWNTPKFPTFIQRNCKCTPFMGFSRACRASGGHEIKKLHNIKNLCLMVTFKSCFMQDPQIPNFYLTNLKTDPFLDFWRARRASGLRRIKKLNKTKSS